MLGVVTKSCPYKLGLSAFVGPPCPTIVLACLKTDITAIVRECAGALQKLTKLTMCL